MNSTETTGDCYAALQGEWIAVHELDERKSDESEIDVGERVSDEVEIDESETDESDERRWRLARIHVGAPYGG